MAKKPSRSRKKRQQRRRQHQVLKTYKLDVPKEPKQTKPSDYVLSRRAELVAKVIKQYPDEVAKGLAERGEAGWHFGRLFLVGAINVQQLQAAHRLDRVTRAYQSMLKQHGHVKAASTERIEGGNHEDLSDDMVEKCRKVKENYDRVYEALSGCGYETKKVVVDALKKDAMGPLHMIRQGLDAISGS